MSRQISVATTASLKERVNTTIPYEIRKKCGFSRNNLISFEEHDQNTVIIRHEKVCDGCGKLNLNEKKAVAKPTNEETLLDFVDSLSRDEQAAMLQHLCKLWLAAGETNA